MSVEEILMLPGSGEVQLTDDAPLSITQAIYDLVVGVGCHVVITPTPIDPTSVSDATMLSAAMYAGRVIDRPDRTTIGFTGLSSWLDSYTETPFTRTAGTPTNWVDDVLINGLTRGTVSGGSNVTRSFPAYAQTRRQILDAVANDGGWEYEVRPNGAINAGTSVFTTTPTVVITKKSEGPDGTYTGLLGGFVDENVDASNITTKVIALGIGAGSSIITGSATKTPALKDRAGNTPTLVQVVNAPNATSSNAATVADNVNTSSDVVVSTTVSTEPERTRDGFPTKSQFPQTGGTGGGKWDPPSAPTPAPPPVVVEEYNGGKWGDNAENAPIIAAATAYAESILGGLGTSRAGGGGGAESQFVRRVVRPGDSVYLYDLESGLVDTSQQITYRGEVIFPMTKRVLSMTWPIERGYGVYIRSNAATPVWYDLTPYVSWENPGATIEVGDRPAGSYSATVNRSNPAIETRVNEVGRVNWTPTVTQGVGITLTVNRGWYVKRPDGTFTACAEVVCTSAGTAANIIQIGTPFTLADSADVGGSIILLDNGTAFRVGNLGEDTTTTAAMYREGDGGKFSAVTLANTDVIRFTMHGTYA